MGAILPGPCKHFVCARVFDLHGDAVRGAVRAGGGAGRAGRGGMNAGRRLRGLHTRA
ncbi:hypothetical protein RKD18_002338 [Streptomyces phaeoluteigriseus]